MTKSFARREREDLRDLKRSAFLFKTDDAVKEYVQMAYNVATKTTREFVSKRMTMRFTQGCMPLETVSASYTLHASI